MNTLWVTADDFGLHPDINAGISECALARRVHAVSVCVNGRYVDWPLLRTLASQGVQIGLHLTWVGEPWLTNKTICVSGWQRWALAWLRHREIRKQAEVEACAQLERLLEQGLRVTHVDAHQHVHVLPGLFQIALRVAEKAGGARIRVPWVPTWRLVRPSLGGVMLQCLASWRKKQLRRFLPCVGIAHSGHNTWDILEHELRVARGWDVEWVTHPGRTTDSLVREYGHWNYDWDAERRLLLDERLPGRVSSVGFRLHSTL